MWARGVGRTLALLAGLMTSGAGACADEGRVGDVTLLGLARDVTWSHTAPGYDYTLACGLPAGGSLAVHDAPDAAAPVTAALEPMITVEVDTSERRDGWIRVVAADRSFTPDGKRSAYTSLLVEGWTRDDHLCAYQEN